MALISNPPSRIIPDPQAFTCTPSSLIASSPCVACYSKHEMIAALVAIIALALGKTANEIISESKCFQCMTEKQMLQSFVTVMGNNLLGDGTSIEDVADMVNCLKCKADRDLLAAFIYGACNLTIAPQVG